jgi:drug/metabolite transporter (DMT)-like permease
VEASAALTPTAIALVVGCAVLWTAFDLVRKLLVHKVDAIPLVFLLTGLQVPLFFAWAAWDGVLAAPPPAYWPPALGSVALNLVANALFIKAIQVSPLSVTIPLLSLTPAFATLVSIPLLGQWPTRQQVVGIVLVVLGAFALHYDPRPRAARRRIEAGSWMMMGVALLWSITPPFDRLALERASPELHGIVLSMGVALGLGLVLLVQGRLGAVKPALERPGLLVAAIATSALALGLQLAALAVASVAVIETAKRGLGNFASVLVGRMAFGESVPLGRWLAVGVMVVGVALILF